MMFYRYVFYWGYVWSLRRYGASQGPEITGVGVVFLTTLINFFCVDGLSRWLFGQQLVPSGLPRYVLWPSALLLFGIHYWCLVRHERYLAIAAEFDRWDADRRWYMNRRVIFYIIGSFVMCGVSMYLARNYPNPLQL